MYNNVTLITSQEMRQIFTLLFLCFDEICITDNRALKEILWQYYL